LYAKIFTQIHDSSLSEDYLARLVFMDLLLLCDEEGIVDITVEAVARRTNVPLDVVRAGIAKLEQPDPQSRSTNEGGRRIVRLDPGRDWGWRIVNYVQYRMIRTKQDRTEYHREYYRSKRSKEDKPQHDSTALNNPQQTQPSAYASASASEVRNTENNEKRIAYARGTTALHDRGGTFPTGGWETPEDFEAWWDKLLRRHPNRSKNGLAKTRALELILDGALDREEFEAGYTALWKVNRARWSDEGGRYAPNLWDFLNDSAWKYVEPPEPRSRYVEIK